MANSIAGRKLIGLTRISLQHAEPQKANEKPAATPASLKPSRTPARCEITSQRAFLFGSISRPTGVEHSLTFC
jgi:hypothetical protein